MGGGAGHGSGSVDGGNVGGGDVGGGGGAVEGGGGMGYMQACSGGSRI